MGVDERVLGGNDRRCEYRGGLCVARGRLGESQGWAGIRVWARVKVRSVMGVPRDIYLCIRTDRHKHRYIHKQRHTQTQTQTHTDTHTHTHTDTNTDTHIHIQKEIDTYFYIHH